MGQREAICASSKQPVCFSLPHVTNIITDLFPSLASLLDNIEPADCPFISNMRTVIFSASQFPISVPSLGSSELTALITCTVEKPLSSDTRDQEGSRLQTLDICIFTIRSLGARKHIHPILFHVSVVQNLGGHFP